MLRTEDRPDGAFWLASDRYDCPRDCRYKDRWGAGEPVALYRVPGREYRKPPVCWHCGEIMVLGRAAVLNQGVDNA